VARTNEEVFQDARDALELTKRGLGEFLGVQGRQRGSGIRNVVVWGRVVTATLCKLKHQVAGFDEWWTPIADELHSDPEFHYLYDLSNDVRHAGTFGRVATSTHIKHMNTADLQPLLANPPPGARNFFVGDRWGGSGWEVVLPDGTTGQFYVTLPADVDITTWLHFTEPTTSLHLAPPSRPIKDVLGRYVAYLETILGSAIQALR
jgi:hypothetical protein